MNGTQEEIRYLLVTYMWHKISEKYYLRYLNFTGNVKCKELQDSAINQVVSEQVTTTFRMCGKVN